MTVEYNSVGNWLTGKFPTLRVGTAVDNTTIDEEGFSRTSGAGTAWDDLRFPLTAHKLGVLSKPDFDETNVGLLFPQNNTAEIVFCIGQLPHTWKEGSTIYPHLHWQQSNANNVVWKLAYKWFNRGGTIPTDFTTLTGDSATNSVITYTSGNISQVTRFGTGGIVGTDKIISSILLMKIYRDDNVDGGAGSGDALAFEFDIHYELNSDGSNTQFTK